MAMLSTSNMHCCKVLSLRFISDTPYNKDLREEAVSVVQSIYEATILRHTSVQHSEYRSDVNLPIENILEAKQKHPSSIVSTAAVQCALTEPQVYTYRKFLLSLGFRRKAVYPMGFSSMYIYAYVPSDME